ncbi:hypothetical protein P152DRAFT_366880, partial [Eremomyces bilateralis CBS 781.70]
NGPLHFANPTRALFRVQKEGDKDAHQFAQGHPRAKPGPLVTYVWKPRNNRKGRHELSIQRTHPSQTLDMIPVTGSIRSTLRGISRMFTKAPVFDISYLVAVIFTLGSVIWCINGFFNFLPLIRPKSEFKGEELVGGGVTAFIGATIFEIGSILLILEALNENRDGCFGWAVHEALDEAARPVEPAIEHCIHHHQKTWNIFRKKAGRSRSVEEGRKETGKPADNLVWIWSPSWYDLKKHFFHEIGFVACFSQLIGATVFWISGFTALPGILNKMSPGLEDGIYWTPQVVGGTGFIISGTLFMLETQKKWWKPAFGVLGWHIGFWNLIGGIGFTICPAFGYDTDSWAQYQASCSTFWGSWAFLIGSVIQWYESLEKYPVRVEA